MTTRAEKFLKAVGQLEFVAEWMLNSQDGKSQDNFMSVLVGIEAVKFFYKMQCLFNSIGIYLQNSGPQGEELKAEEVPSPEQTPSTLAHLNGLIQKMKARQYLQKHNQGMTETSSTGKSISLQSIAPISKVLRLKGLSYKDIVGELLHLLRPLIYVIFLKVHGTKSYKPWAAALIMDLVRWLVQSRMAVRNTKQMSEHSQRKREMISKALFRTPFYGEIFKPRVIEPILNRFMSCDRWIYRIIMYLLDMRSSITLTI